jgi:O-antigen ligase
MMIATSRTRLHRSAWRLYAPASALLLWACLWLNLNSGFWNIQAPHSFDDWQLFTRAVLPFAVLPVACFLVLSRRKLDMPGLSPSQLLMIYGLVAAIASVVSPDPAASLYWSVTFLATILVAWTFPTTHTPVLSARQMLQITWAVMAAVAAIIAYTGRGLIYGSAPSAYSIEHELHDLVISSGVARWAAVPGLVCILKAYHTRRPAHIAFFLAVAGAAFFIVYRMQSRGAIFGSAAALLFALFTSSRLRRYALPYTVFAVLLLIILETPNVLSNRVTEYLERGQTEAEFINMSGRTSTYNKGIAAFRDAPVLGRGQWADRLIGIGHAHNSYLQALMNAGILGGIPYVASWIAGWVLFFRLQSKRHVLRPEDRLVLLEAGAVMMFFTVRSVPETTTASFAVDLLVMAAVYVYFETLAASPAPRPLPRSARTPLQESAPKIRHSLQVASRPRPVAGVSPE